MKRSALLLLLFLLALQASALVLAQSREPSPSPLGAASAAGDCELLPGPNLLNNPSFEGEYHPYAPPGGHPDCDWDICFTAMMADGWTPYWRSHLDSEPKDQNRMPEYKRADYFVPGPERVHSGDYAQQYFTFHATHEAGVYQQVAVSPGTDYCFSIWGHSWSSSNDDPWTSDLPLEQWIGIDPTGGTDWQSDAVVWGPPIQQYNEYAQFSMSVTAQASQLTVFTRSRPIWPAKHNDVYWDTATLKSMSGSAELTVTPENLRFLTEAGTPQMVSGQIMIDLGGFEDVDWTATLEPGGTLAPSVTPTTGTGPALIDIAVDTTGYGSGIYSAQLTISTESEIPGNPTTVPITLHVVDEISPMYIPLSISQP